MTGPTEHVHTVFGKNCGTCAEMTRDYAAAWDLNRTLIFNALNVVETNCPPETERFVLQEVRNVLPRRSSGPNAWNELTLAELRVALNWIRERRAPKVPLTATA